MAYLNPRHPPLPGMPESPKDMKPSELLTATAAYIEEHGWTQFSGRGEHGEACTLIAARAVALERASTGAFTEAVHALQEVAQELYGSWVSIPVFNDLACDDQTDIAMWIEKARAQLEEQGQ